MVDSSSICQICIGQSPDTLFGCNHVFHIICVLNRFKEKTYDCAICPENLSGPVKVVCWKCRRMYKDFNLTPDTTESALRLYIGDFECEACYMQG